jgi:hypothetical protein
MTCPFSGSAGLLAVWDIERKVGQNVHYDTDLARRVMLPQTLTPNKLPRAGPVLAKAPAGQSTSKDPDPALITWTKQSDARTFFALSSASAYIPLPPLPLPLLPFSDNVASPSRHRAATVRFTHRYHRTHKVRLELVLVMLVVPRCQGTFGDITSR